MSNPSSQGARVSRPASTQFSYQGPSPQRNYYQVGAEFTPVVRVYRHELEMEPERLACEMYKRVRGYYGLDHISRAGRKAGVTHVQVLIVGRVWTLDEGMGLGSQAIEALRPDAMRGLLAASPVRDRWGGLGMKPLFMDMYLDALNDSGLQKESAYVATIYAVYVRAYRSVKGKTTKVRGRPRRQQESPPLRKVK